MSHQPERNEKDCLNCGNIVKGRYCQACGQENIQTKQNALSFVKHFIYDVFHFDGKFFDTLKNLFRRPGFVPKEYVAGRRMSYLDPIRMYLFTSAIFFLIFFSTNQINYGITNDWDGRLDRQERLEVLYELANKKGGDTTFHNTAVQLLLDSTYTIRILEQDSSDMDSLIFLRGEVKKFSARLDTTDLVNEDDTKNGNWLKRTLAKRARKYRDNEKEGIRNLLDTFIHRMPYMLFISLPFFALVLKLLYVRRRQFYYTDHLVFTLYHYIFSFILLLIIVGLSKLENWLDWAIFGWLIGLLTLYGMYYLYKSMRVFYGQRRAKTIGKFMLLNTIGFFLIFCLFLIFLIITAIQL